VGQKGFQTRRSRQLDTSVIEDMFLYCKDTLPYKLVLYYIGIFLLKEYDSEFDVIFDLHRR
jgi:hypothetical protein